MSESKKSKVLAVMLSVIASLVTAFIVGYVALFNGLSVPNYGGWLFLLLPFLCGSSAAVVGNWKSPLSSHAGWSITGWWLLVSSTIILIAAWEGIICLVMASPLLFFGHAAGYYLVIELKARKLPRAGQVSFLPCLALATVVAAKQIPPREVRSQTTVMEVDAPPEKIWPLLFNLSEIRPPSNPFFLAGVAHPIATRASGREVGDARECVLTTGIMHEQITESVPNRRMGFKVLETPASMRELNPFRPTYPAHLHDNYVVHHGQFALVPLANGRTRIIGKSTYSYAVQPAGYWNLWTDSFVRQIHLSVISEIKRRVER